MFSDLLHAKFKLNARGPKEYDCYGLYLEVNKRIGKIVPDVEKLAVHTAEVINKNILSNIHNFKEVNENDKQIGDAILFIPDEGNMFDHIAVVISKYNFMQISETKSPHVVSFGHPWFKSKVKGFYRYE